MVVKMPMLTVLSSFFKVPFGWDLISALTNSGNYGKKVGGAIIVVFGIILIIYGVFKVFKAITGREGSEGPQWFKAALALIAGGAMEFGAWTLFESIANGGQNTVSQLGGGGVVMLLKFLGL